MWQNSRILQFPNHKNAAFSPFLWQHFRLYTAMLCASRVRATGGQGFRWSPCPPGTYTGTSTTIFVAIRAARPWVIMPSYPLPGHMQTSPQRRRLLQCMPIKTRIFARRIGWRLSRVYLLYGVSKLSRFRVALQEHPVKL